MKIRKQSSEPKKPKSSLIKWEEAVKMIMKACNIDKKFADQLLEEAVEDGKIPIYILQ